MMVIIIYPVRKYIDNLEHDSGNQNVTIPCIIKKIMTALKWLKFFKGAKSSVCFFFQGHKIIYFSLSLSLLQYLAFFII